VAASRTIEAEEDGTRACLDAVWAVLIHGGYEVGAPLPGGQPSAEPGGGCAAVPRSGAALISIRLRSATQR